MWVKAIVYESEHVKFAAAVNHNKVVMYQVLRPMNEMLSSPRNVGMELQQNN